MRGSLAVFFCELLAFRGEDTERRESVQAGVVRVFPFVGETCGQWFRWVQRPAPSAETFARVRRHKAASFEVARSCTAMRL